MKKIFISLLFLSYFFAPSLSFAQQNLNPCITGNVGGTNVTNQFGVLCTNVTNKDNTAQIIRNVITVAFVIAVLLALFFLIRGGINWVTSGGDKGKIDASRQMIIAAIVGLIVTFAAYFILSVVLGIFGLNLNSLIIPQIIPGNSTAPAPTPTPPPGFGP